MATDIVIQLNELALDLKRGQGKSTLYGAATEIEYLRKEISSLKEQHNANLIALSKSVNDPGPNPKLHFSIMKKHRKEWPTLWQAIDSLIMN